MRSSDLNIPMKALLVSLFIVSIVEADRYALTPLAPILLRQDAAQLEKIPSLQIGDWMIEPLLYTVEKPTETPMTVPLPLAVSPPERVTFAPVFPEHGSFIQNGVSEDASATIRAQSLTIDEVSGVLASPPPVARGAVESEKIDPKLIESTNASELENLVLPTSPADISVRPDSAKPSTATTDPAGYGVLFVVMLITIFGFVWMALVAYDYHQRWTQSLMLQNDRYLGGGYDMETDDLYRDYLAGTPAH